MLEPAAIVTVTLAGLSWIAEQVAGNVVGKATDRLLASRTRGLRERIAGLAGSPEAQVLARGVRMAHLEALDRVIRDYQEAGRPEWSREPHTRPDIFFKRSLDFCARSLRRARDDSANLQLDLAVLDAGVNELLTAPADDGPADRRGAAVAAATAGAALAELQEALDGVTLPPGFEEHFKHGSGDKLPFLALFGRAVARQMKKDAAFRDLVETGRLLRIEALAADTRDLASRIDERFSGAFERVEEKLDAQTRALNELVVRISAEKGVPVAPLRAILERLGEVDVPDDQIPDRLAAKAEEYLALREQWAKLASGHPDLTAVRNEALASIDAGDLDGARALLEEAREQIRRARHDRLRDEASLVVDLAGIDRLELRYRAAADRYREAAALVEPFDTAMRSGFLLEGGNVLYEQGVEFGDNDALRWAISVFREAARLHPRTEQPVEWAKIQVRLGNAHAVLGERERGTASLESAVAAYRAALEEQSREDVPLDWAVSQHNLANVLQEIGDREVGTDRQREAIAAYRTALEEMTRERSPLNWAMIQNNLGNAVLALARREEHSGYAEEAVDAFRNSLQEWTRERVPLRWATVQNNLGNALAFLGEREHSSERLDEAIIAYNAALEEWTRERVPLDWAMAQLNLGVALLILGRRDCDAVSLEQAVARFRDAMEESTRERVSLDWAVAQMNLGEALTVLGECTRSAEHLDEAIGAYHEALEEFEKAEAEFYIKEAKRNLDKAREALSKLRSGEP